MKNLQITDEESILNLVYKSFIEELKLKIYIGIELEFYINDNVIEFKEIFETIIQEAAKREIYIVSIKDEKGKNQFEVEMPYNNPLIVANQAMQLKKIISDITHNNSNFEAKPYFERPGSAMHFNISLHDFNGKNLFKKDNEIINKYLSHSIGGLLKLMKESMIYFAPNENSYKRFDNNFETPTKICWGGNNRTTALRVPTVQNKNNLRIEHRVAGSDCNIYLSITAIIVAISYGIKHEVEADKQIYGNAFGKQYELEKLPMSLEKSIKYYNKGEILKKYLSYLRIECSE
ncbi:MAG: glutamine synthetase [Alphaproteobacteria bacterium]